MTEAGVWPADLLARVVAAHTGCPASDHELVAERREVAVFGLPFELVWMPSRAGRPDVPSRPRPAFAPGRGERIRASEAVAAANGIVVTPNRFPFWWPQALVWPEQGTMRELREDFLAACFALAEAVGGSVLFNSIGASASIALAHGHLLAGQSRVLRALPLAEVASARGLRVLATDPAGAVPFLVVAVECADPELRARLVRKLLDARTTQAVNVLAAGDRAWIVPRSVEVPAPHFPFAVGSGELFGRFIYPEREAMQRARPEDIAAALVAATVPADRRELEALGELLASGRT